MATLDFGLFGLDAMGSLEKEHCLDGVTEFQDILGFALENTVQTESKKEFPQTTSWEDDTDEFLQSMLTGSDFGTVSQLDLGSETVLGCGSESAVLSDTSSDSGMVEDNNPQLLQPPLQQRTLVSPGLEDGPRMLSPGLDSPLPQSPAQSLDLIGYLDNESDTGDSMYTINTDNGDSLTSYGYTLDPLRGMDPLKVAMAPVLADTNDITDTLEPMLGQSNNRMSSSSSSSSSSCSVTTSYGNVESAVVAPRVSVHSGGGLDPVVSTTTGTTTIILPAIGATQTNNSIGPGMTFSSHRLSPREAAPNGPCAKRRRVSASSDSGVDDNNKYSRLTLNPEEQKMAAKEGMAFPKYYPLTREEERNLKKIRRKIRNKLSAQDSRRRKKDYLDSMEDRVKICADENQQLKDKIQALETQNKTLAAQLRRLHQIVVNGGLRQGGQGQRSTALMVLLLSTALFLIPGVRDQTAETKSETYIQNAVKMPPMPGQSRSLLQFDSIDRNHDIADLADFEEEVKTELGMRGEADLLSKGHSPPPPRQHTDHDYTAIYAPGTSIKVEKTEPGKAWIDEDAPPLGYGSAVTLGEREVITVVDDDEDRHMNVNVSSSGQGTRTVVLQIPKDIQ